MTQAVLLLRIKRGQARHRRQTLLTCPFIMELEKAKSELQKPEAEAEDA